MCIYKLMQSYKKYPNSDIYLIIIINKECFVAFNSGYSFFCHVKYKFINIVPPSKT